MAQLLVKKYSEYLRILAVDHNLIYRSTYLHYIYIYKWLWIWDIPSCLQTSTWWKYVFSLVTTNVLMVTQPASWLHGKHDRIQGCWVVKCHFPWQNHFISYSKWLVVWNLFFSPYIGNVIIPTDFHIFQRGWNHQPGKVWWLFLATSHFSCWNRKRGETVVEENLQARVPFRRSWRPSPLSLLGQNPVGRGLSTGSHEPKIPIDDLRNLKLMIFYIKLWG